MELSVAGDVAMILPVPVVRDAGEDALTFVNLERHANFFDSMRELFEPDEQRSLPKRRSPFSLSAPKLRVHDVGSFEASFVPSMRDFQRLDDRFRLSEDVWNGLGDYADWGFAVFRLKGGKRKTIHPMAFRFLTRDDRRLFFPTVHVHDGKVHAHARFDHALYYQGAADDASDPRSFMRASQSYEGLVAQGEQVSRRELRGKLPNRDTWVAVSRTRERPGEAQW
jgi:hypothetical protein